MNYREFTERVYNYKHGLTNSAESQTNENIEHSAKGDEWNQHKYKEKIYLGNGTFRYIYDDGTESTGTKPLEYDDPGRQSQRAKPLVDNFNARQATKEQAQGIANTINTNNQIAQGKAQEAERIEAGRKSDQGSKALYQESDLAERSIVEAASQPNADVYSIAVRYKTSPAMIYDILSRRNSSVITPSIEAAKDDTKVYTSYPSDAGTQSPSNQDFLQARNDSYSSESSKPVPYAQQEKEIAAGKANEAKAIASGTPSGNGANSLFQSEVDTLLRKAKAAGDAKKAEIAQGKEMEAKYGGTGGDTSNIENSALANKTASDLAKQAQAPNFADALKETGANTVAPRQGTPYADLQAQSVAASRNASAQNIVNTYMDGILDDVSTPLRSLGISDDVIWAAIDEVEKNVAGEGIANSLKDVGSNKEVLFFPGAEDGLMVYTSEVLPALRQMVANMLARN